MNLTQRNPVHGFSHIRCRRTFEGEMTHSVEDILGDVKLAVGRPTATAFVNPGAEDRFFILESLFAGAALFLVNRYFAGFFKPLEETGARHRQMAIRLLEELSKGTLSQKL